MKHDILVVEDERDIREMIAGILSDEGCDVRVAATSETALKEVKLRLPSLVILDVWLKGSRMDGIELLNYLKADHEDLPVIIISGHGTVETAVAAIRKGAFDYIVKPFKSDKLLVTANRALENAKLKRENRELKTKTNAGDRLIGRSAVIAQLRTKIDRVAPTNSRVLISGPSGSGKELLARLIHEKSQRHAGPFIAVNAASMVPNCVETELFGNVDEAGVSVKPSLLERAHNGTLYLDEVGDMPLETQVKLLRLLIEQRFQRVGGTDNVQVDVRVITSTSRKLEQEARQGRFREDLYHRLNVMPLVAPPLTARREDIPELVEYFIDRLSVSTGLPARRISPDAMAALQSNDWPGNVRQLRNNIERLLIMATGDPSDPITLDNLPSEVSVSKETAKPKQECIISMPLRDARKHFERDYLQVQIERFGGNISKTASFVGMERSALHRKLKSLGVARVRTY
ncbi:MAG: sigma-54-dependent Fis family transcriptional regulator [Hyphomonadaceae bacterium]|nr:sigma-54-dependent Fis family transcriptional regulator [Hyphomonadaceae bacterium]